MFKEGRYVYLLIIICCSHLTLAVFANDNIDAFLPPLVDNEDSPGAAFQVRRITSFSVIEGDPDWEPQARQRLSSMKIHLKGEQRGTR